MKKQLFREVSFKTLTYFVLGAILTLSVNPMSFGQEGTETAEVPTDHWRARIRRVDTWQFLMGLGLSYNLVSQDHKSSADFQSQDGVGIPISMSFAAFHPREAGSIHWGYSFDMVAHSKKDSVLLHSRESSFSAALLGGGFLYYTSPARQTFLRVSGGLAGVGFETIERESGAPEVRERTDFANGLGVIGEVGSLLPWSTVEERIFTYSASVSYLKAGAKENSVSSLSTALKLGVLW